MERNYQELTKNYYQRKNGFMSNFLIILGNFFPKTK